MWSRLAAPLLSGARPAVSAAGAPLQARGLATAAKAKPSAPVALSKDKEKAMRQLLREMPKAKKAPSKRGASAYGMFVKEKFPKVFEQQTGEDFKTKFRAATSALSRMWSETPEASKQEFEKKADESKAHAQAAYKEYLASLTPKDHAIAAKRAALMKSLGMRGADKVKVPQPSNKPKLPPSPYLAFMSAMYKLSPEEQRAKLGAELKGAAAKNTTFLRKKFEELPESEKKKYVDAREAAMATYRTEMAKYKEKGGVDRLKKDLDQRLRALEKPKKPKARVVQKKKQPAKKRAPVRAVGKKPAAKKATVTKAVKKPAASKAKKATAPKKAAATKKPAAKASPAKKTVAKKRRMTV